LLNKYTLKPEVTLFIDDTLNNITTAIELGLKTIHLKDVFLLPLYIKECGVVLK